MEAKVKQSYRWDRLIAFSGREYTKYGFSFVPPENEASARADERLEVREAAEPEIVQVVEVAEKTEVPEMWAIPADVHVEFKTEELREEPYVDWKPARKRHKKIESEE